jgi:membrane protein implicated in regulation of membrane protease activity
MGHHIMAKAITILSAAMLALLLLLALVNLFTPLVTLILLVPALGGGIMGARVLFHILRHTPYSNGQERFYNQEATVIVALSPEGRVRFHGENWAATLDDPFVAEHRYASSACMISA